MRILSFYIENFRNLRLAECKNVPKFMVICGGNGSGKSALLEALMTVKEIAGSYGEFQIDPRVVSADAEKSIIKLELEFTEGERSWVKQKFIGECPKEFEIIVEIDKDGSVIRKTPHDLVHRLLIHFSSALDSPGFFDFIHANRRTQKTTITTWDPSLLTDYKTKQTLGMTERKFQNTKQYLAGLKIKDLQNLQVSIKFGSPVVSNLLDEIKELFNSFFAPKRFEDVIIHEVPFKFVISTPLGNIDIDDLSSGEKEIFNIFIRFHQLKPKEAIILYDEADAHLHPDLEYRYLKYLKKLAKDNQLILTTHSPEMMIAAGTDSLYTILKEPQQNGSNQFLRVTEDEDLHNILSELMGSRGIISFNQRIVFIEGVDSSADRSIYEAAYPPSQYNVSFVPVGNSAMVSKIAEKVNSLLTSPVAFQQYFSIVDRDIERFDTDPTEGKRLFRLPVYHIENLLLNDNDILEVMRAILGAKCPFSSAKEIVKDLQELIFSDTHLKPYTRAISYAKLAHLYKIARESFFKGDCTFLREIKKPKFSEIENEARKRLQSAISDNTWRSKCKGRALLKAFCKKYQLKYEHFRNLLIDRIKTPPKLLKEIMNKILNT
ncbi:MAG: AAA family ATPase [Promethearchaeota archaeon]